MKIVSFHSGLGNQIYFYLYSLYLQQKYPDQQIYGYYPKDMLSSHNGLEIEKVFNIKLQKNTWYSDLIALCCRVLHKLRIEHFRTVEPNDNDDGVLFVGYYQDKKYFLDNVDGLEFKDIRLDDKNRQILSEIEASESVSIHIRRGDYFKPEVQRKYGNIATDDYYKKARKTIKQKLKNPHYFIFSNDIEWCKHNLHLENMVFVEGNNGNKSSIDMYLMSRCKHNIIANSSFSYWASMLNKNENKTVIYPEIWDNDKTPDIFPEGWIGLR